MSYDALGRLSAVTENPDGSYLTYHYDRRGSTVVLTDEGGRVTDRFQYGPYGELVYRSGTNATPFLYNGRDGVMTDNNGLYYMRARSGLGCGQHFAGCGEGRHQRLRRPHLQACKTSNPARDSGRGFAVAQCSGHLENRGNARGINLVNSLGRYTDPFAQEFWTSCSAAVRRR
ncbi:hypothetical protein [Desulfofundulus thermosubterraneus]|uniref:RHS Repeat n=1 Tax=Desulfofundulus thermosubterraneus DSM 16057 TaxID=1121432 RepID=A0A1M6IBD1_9FIRM|nr:hypothetical protein [Desulfofundulus thermosubterraneus]SHJ31741.1 RHS Repeat [Desulfofundulus thermosubterraneus DSM 16057]